MSESRVLGQCGDILWHIQEAFEVQTQNNKNVKLTMHFGNLEDTGGYFNRNISLNEVIPILDAQPASEPPNEVHRIQNDPQIEMDCRYPLSRPSALLWYIYSVYIVNAQTESTVHSGQTVFVKCWMIHYSFYYKFYSPLRHLQLPVTLASYCMHIK